MRKPPPPLPPLGRRIPDCGGKEIPTHGRCVPASSGVPVTINWSCGGSGASHHALPVIEDTNVGGVPLSAVRTEGAASTNTMLAVRLSLGLTDFTIRSAVPWLTSPSTQRSPYAAPVLADSVMVESPVPAAEVTLTVACVPSFLRACS